MPEHQTIEWKEFSKPYNSKLAGVFFKSGMIEAWGRGFDKIREACAKYDAPLPEYDISAAGIMVLCKACDKYLEFNDTITTTKGMEVTGKSEAQVRRYLKVLTDCGVIKSKKNNKRKYVYKALKQFAHLK